MARTLTPQDCYQLMTGLVHQATGQSDIVVTDTSSFVSAGETVLATGKENVLNSLSILVVRTLLAVRPYKRRITLMEEIDTGLFSNRLRKISYYARNPLPSGNFNTNLFTNLANGYTHGTNNGASTHSMWEQHQPLVLEMNFAGSSTWQYCQTIYEDQLQIAFKDPGVFASFMAGVMTEAANDIEREREAWNRMVLLNKIGAIANGTGGKVMNLTEMFNDEFGTSYTSEELRTTHLKEFLEFFTYTFKLESKYMTESSVARHNPMTKTRAEVDPVSGENVNVEYDILRHTPYDRQRVYLYSPLFTKAEALVLPEIFHDGYLKQDTQYQEITYWQSQNDRPAVKVVPAVYDTVTGTQIQGEAVDIPYVIGLITDVDGLMTNFQAEISRSTPVEARKGYRNIWTTFLKNAINDPTENAVLFIMQDETEPEPEPEPEPATPVMISTVPGSSLTMSEVTTETDAMGWTTRSATLTGELAPTTTESGTSYIFQLDITGPEDMRVRYSIGLGPGTTISPDPMGNYFVEIDAATYVAGRDKVIASATTGLQSFDLTLNITLGEADDNQNGEPEVGA